MHYTTLIRPSDSLPEKVSEMVPNQWWVVKGMRDSIKTEVGSGLDSVVREVGDHTLL